MSVRIQPVRPEIAEGKTMELYLMVKSKFGKVPNALQTMGHSPAALESYLALSGALAKGTLSARSREQIALAVSEENHCEYCLAAHSLTGKIAGLKPDEIVAARQGSADDAKEQALIDLASALLNHRGDVPDAVLENARDVGVSDAELVETVANVAAMTFTNFLNQLAHTEVDFPKVPVAAY